MTNIKMLRMTYGRAIQVTCITSQLLDECPADKLVAELKRSWPIRNSLWALESNPECVENRKPNQHLIWVKFQQEYFLEFPNVVRLCQIMVTTPASTSPLEKSYTKLQLVAAKRRNHSTSENLEVLYLPAAINHFCLSHGVTEYDAEIKTLYDSLTYLQCFFCCVGSSPPKVFLWKCVLKDMQ